MSKKLIIFDADSMIFTVAWKFREKKVKALVNMHLNKFISEVILNTGATHYIGFFGSKHADAAPNFRYAIDPNYKLNRPETPEWVKRWRPILFDTMEEKWGFVGVDGMEADDAVAIAAEHYQDEYDEIIVAAVDKDLQQIPNITYYNYQKHESHFINAFDAAMNLGVQLLMGDSTDNIKGLEGVGPKKAVKLLADCTSIPQIKWTIARMYAEHEEGFRRKAEKAIFADTRKEVAADPDNATLTDKQIDRVTRIQAKKELENVMFDAMPGGWKKYLKTQMGLLIMLTEAPAGFTLPEPIESTLVPRVSSDVDAVAPVKTKPIDKPTDNFLYL